MNWTSFTLKRHGMGILVALFFQTAGVMTINDYGVTIDEWATLEAGRQNLKMIDSFFEPGPLHPWYEQELPGYSFPLDTLLALADKLFPWGKPADYYSNTIRLLRLTGSSLTIFLLYLIAYSVSQNRRVAVFSALTLALFPQFIAHAQNNPKDQPAMFTFTLALYLAVRLVLKPGWTRTASAGAGWGLALVTRFLSFLVLPIMALWISFYHRRTLFSHWKYYIGFLLTGLASAFLLWPWIWTGTFSKLWWASHHVLSFHFNIPEVYLGEIHRSTQMPWHYFIVNFFAFTPLPYLFFSLLCLYLFAPVYRLQRNLRSVAALAALWCLVSLVVETASPSQYNALRHFMLIFPGFCLLAGCGVEIFLQHSSKFLGRWIDSAKASITSLLICGLLYAWSLSQIIYMHPHQGAFLNEIANALIPDQAENYFTIEYFYHTYREGSQFLNDTAEENAEIIVAFYPHCARPFLRKRSPERPLSDFFDISTPKYLMYVTRLSRYNDVIKEIENKYEPVFTIRRQKGTLLKIYKNTGPMRAG